MTTSYRYVADFKVTRQTEVFKSLNITPYQIKDDILFDCIGLGRASRFEGFNRDKRFGYALLTYFATTALNFRRMPFCEDRVYRQYFFETEKYSEILNELDQQRIQSICDELYEIYQFTQDALKRTGLSHVRLRREIKISQSHHNKPSQAEHIIKLKEAAKLLGMEYVNVEMDTLNSFGDEGAYVTDVRLELEMPIEDILYCSTLIGNRSVSSNTMESGEWVVINRSPTGIVKLPVDAISYHNSMFSFYHQMTENTARDFLYKHNPFVIEGLHGFVDMYGTQGITPTRLNKLLKKFRPFFCKK